MLQLKELMTGVLLESPQRKNAWSGSGSDLVLLFFPLSFSCLFNLPGFLMHLQRADFWNEARKLADLHHPNVLAFYGVVLDGPGGSVATVTEYMVNGSLRQALQRNDKYVCAFMPLLLVILSSRCHHFSS